MKIKQMLNSSIIYLYKTLPPKFKNIIGQASWLKGIRNKLLYTKKGFETAVVDINRSYGDYKLDFKFCAALKVASAARYKGIENTLLENSFSLIKKYKKNRIDLNIIDIGANFGYLSTVWASSIAVKGNTIAFEPNRNIFSCVTETLNLNKLQDRFEAYNLALGNENKMISLNVSQLSSNSNSMKDSINNYNIEMVTLDTFLENKLKQDIDVIKIDVDGIELEILKGAKKTLQTNDVIAIVETNNDVNIIEFFKNINYVVFDMKLKPYLEDKEQLPLNIFCLPKSLINNAV